MTITDDEEFSNDYNAETSNIEDAEAWGAEYEDDIDPADLESLVVYSRDWTVETVFSQIAKGNINLDPDFQRRNAWNDVKRSKLIESLVTNLPVPEIVLAEDKDKKGSFIVIDGKQRLLAIAGFMDPDSYPSWGAAKLKSLKIRNDLKDRTFIEFESDVELGDDYRKLMNSDIRCTVLTNYKNDSVLYDIFHRLNSGSVPLNSQELRQVLNRGEFTNFLMEETKGKIPLHEVMNLKGADARLRDAEILLRFIAFSMFGDKYKGSLNTFLSEVLSVGNTKWAHLGEDIKEKANDFHRSTQIMLDIFPKGKVGRKFSHEKWESRFNRVLFEVESYYFTKIDENIAKRKGDEFIKKFEDILGKDSSFIESIESSTKTLERYYTRFSKFENVMSIVFDIPNNDVPVKMVN